VRSSFLLPKKNGNTLELRLAENLGFIRTDRTKLKQSLLNVLSNGSKFTENGKLTLFVERFDADRWYGLQFRTPASA
jgi:signal transduction histidine kinase